MKKILALMLILALCLSLAAFAVSCKDPGEDDHQGGSVTPPDNDDENTEGGEDGGEDDGNGDNDDSGDNGGNQGGSGNPNIGPWLEID